MTDDARNPQPSTAQVTVSGVRPPARRQWPLPQGVSDLFFQEAAVKRVLEQELRDLFGCWSYSELIPPTFEYAETLASEAGTQLAEEMYRFVDRDGRTIALRPDLTIPTARVVGTRLFDLPMPLRLFYIGSVFRYEPPQAGRQREFTQAGIELVGAAAAAADVEVLALAIEALRVAGVQGYRVALGQMAFFRGLLAEVDASSQLIQALQSAIDRKNPDDLSLALAQIEALQAGATLHSSLRRTLLALPQLHGGREILEESRAYCLNEAMLAAVERLQDIHELLQAYGIADAVSYDLGETRGMEYYTGITFKGYVPGLGFSVCSGGRYDDLVGHFGPPQPAVGCALWLDRLLLARQRQGWRMPALRPDLLVVARGCPECLAVVRALRQRGLRVEVDVQDPSTEHMLGSSEWPVAVCAGDDQVRLLDAEGAQQMTSTVLLELLTERWASSVVSDETSALGGLP